MVLALGALSHLGVSPWGYGEGLWGGGMNLMIWLMETLKCVGISMYWLGAS